MFKILRRFSNGSTSRDLKEGDRVRSGPDAGDQETHGVVEQKITPSNDGTPQYVVRSTKTGQTTVHDPDQLRRAKADASNSRAPSGDGGGDGGRRSD